MGQTFSLAHLAPFVDISRQKYKTKVLNEAEELGIQYTEEQIKEIVNLRLSDEIKNAVQLIQYQLVTLLTTNGQTPFVTMFINLAEAKEGQERDDLVALATEVFKQRIQGVKNEKGVYITPAFPKIVYVIDEENAPLDENAKYHNLTVLAASCTARRMVPDYISAKVAKELKEGNVVAPMGCVSGESIIEYKINGHTCVSSFSMAWDRLSSKYEVKTQPDGKNLYIDTPDVEIYDCKLGIFVRQHRIIRNVQDEWKIITFRSKSGFCRKIDVTFDHPFEIIGKGVVLAENLEIGDTTLFIENQKVVECKVDNITTHYETKYSYDVTTESEHFTVNGIYSHNCRSFLTVDRFADVVGNISNSGTFDKYNKHFYGRFNQG